MVGIKMTSRSKREVERDDVVTRKAKQLSLTPEAVFSRAYAEAGHDSMTGAGMFAQYYYPGSNGKRFHIPHVVREFCKKPPPSCGNIDCENPNNGKVRPPLSVVGSDGSVSYFCSDACRALAAVQGIRSKTDKVELARVGKAIFTTICLAISAATLEIIPEEKIRFMPNQPRKYFDPQRLQSLAESMSLPGMEKDKTLTGQLMPGFVRRIPKDKNGCEYELLDGERRLRAVRIAGITIYRALVVNLDDEGARHVVSIMANFNRENHTVLELVDTVVHLHDELGFTYNEVAATIGKHYIQVLDLYRMRNLVPEVRDMLDPEKTPKKKMLTQGAAIEIAKMPAGQQLSLAKQSVEGGMRVDAIKAVVRESRPSSSREIAPEERRRTLHNAIRRFTPVVQNIRTAARKASEEKAIEGFEKEDMSEMRKILKEADTMLREIRTLVGSE